MAQFILLLCHGLRARLRRGRVRRAPWPTSFNPFFIFAAFRVQNTYVVLAQMDAGICRNGWRWTAPPVIFWGSSAGVKSACDSIFVSICMRVSRVCVCIYSYYINRRNSSVKEKCLRPTLGEPRLKWRHVYFEGHTMTPSFLSVFAKLFDLIVGTVPIKNRQVPSLLCHVKHSHVVDNVWFH